MNVKTIIAKINKEWDWQLIVPGFLLHLLLESTLTNVIGTILLCVGSYRFIKKNITKNTFGAIVITIIAVIVLMIPGVLLKMQY